tara:strand:- start:959 stop:1132 length:174 start_codon:yes stop_codon:yes gene_type:complete
MIARTIQRELPPPKYQHIGLVVGEQGERKDSGKMYMGPEWAQNLSSDSFFVVKRNNN